MASIAMASIAMASIAIAALAVFVVGATIGVIMLVSLAVRREDRHASLKGQAGNVSGVQSAIRRVTRIGDIGFPGGPVIRRGLSKRGDGPRRGGRRSPVGCGGSSA